MTTGSFFNNLMLGSGHPEPEVGMGVTYIMWTDRAAGTIVEVIRFKTGKRVGQIRAIVTQADKAIRTDDNGMSDAQTYRYERQPDARRKTHYADKDGGFKYLSIGHRSYYHDYSF